jgi:cysteine synthase
MSLQGEIITAFVAALGTIGTTVGLVAYLLRDLRADIQELRTEVRSDIHELRTEVRSDIGDVRSEIRQVLVELLHHVQTGHNPPPPQAA